MTQPQNFIHQFEQILLANHQPVGEIENTTGNYDDQGHLIDQPIPTITTDFCEIGAYGHIIYFTFIVDSNSYTRQLFEAFQNYLNVQFYGFKDFYTTLYPRPDFNYQEFEYIVKKDKYFQIQFNYQLGQEISELFEDYLVICDKIVRSQARVINQLIVNPREKNY